MLHYKILSARTGVSDAGIGGTAVTEQPIVAEVRLMDESGKDFYVCLSVIAGVPDFFRTDVSTFNLQMREELSEAEEAMLVNILENNHMDFGGFDEIFEKEDPDWYDIQRYLIFLTECNEEETGNYIKLTTGLYMDEIFIPASEVEMIYS